MISDLFLQKIPDEVRGPFCKLRHLSDIRALLEWDRKTYMPPRAREGRETQITFLAAEIHALKTDSTILESLKNLGDVAESEQEKRLVTQTLRRFEKNTFIPLELAKKLAQAEVRTHSCWLEARKANSFQVVKQELSTVIALKREYAQRIREHMEFDSDYHCLMDDFDPGISLTETKSIFSSLKLEKILTAGIRHSSSTSRKSPPKVAKDIQRILQEELIKLIGFDYSAGRLDATVHPFCGRVGNNDVRLTTEFNEDDFVSGLFAILHEAGHGIYSQGLLRYLPSAASDEAWSLTLHESQSLFWENNVGRSPEFLSNLFSLLSKFGVSWPDGAENFQQHVTHVMPGLRRIDADEVSYGLHILIRFELEEALIESELSVDDLPEHWNELYTKHLKLTPNNDFQGVLQDIHWFTGAFGYFPCYLLGAMYAAQMAISIRDSGCAFTINDYPKILNWLRENVHQYGSLYSASELLAHACPNTDPAESYTNYLQAKYVN